MDKTEKTVLIVAGTVGTLAGGSLAFYFWRQKQPTKQPAQLPLLLATTPGLPGPAGSMQGPPSAAAPTSAPSATASSKAPPPEGADWRASRLPTLPPPPPDQEPPPQSQSSLSTFLDKATPYLIGAGAGILADRFLFSNNRESRRRLQNPPQTVDNGPISYPTRDGEDPQAVPASAQEIDGYLSGFWIGTNYPTDAKHILALVWQAGNSKSQPPPQIYWHKIGAEDAIENLPPRIPVDTQTSPATNGSNQDSYQGGYYFGSKTPADAKLERDILKALHLSGDSTYWWRLSGLWDGINGNPPASKFPWPPSKVTVT
jgi:hypothetical protein